MSNLQAFNFAQFIANHSKRVGVPRFEYTRGWCKDVLATIAMFTNDSDPDLSRGAGVGLCSSFDGALAFATQIRATSAKRSVALLRAFTRPD